MHKHARGHYMKLALMTVLSFASMYVLMYAMVDRMANVHSSLNRFHMAALMIAPMVLAIRIQAGIHDAQSLRPMIPHHAGSS